MPHKDPEQRLQYHRDRRASIREIIAKAKNVPCADCGVKYPTCVMQFDHVRGVKLLNIGSATAKIKTVVSLLEEIAKCEVVCANCHALRTESRKIARCGPQLVLKTRPG